MKDIDSYSDPQEVLRKVHKYLGRNTDLYLSTRQKKKYMLLNPDTNKFIHFGEIGYIDYTKSKDKKLRDNFRQRNHKWKDAPKYSPAYLAYHCLW
jgi:hypothetical protein